MKRTIGGIPIFAVMVLILIVLLQIANWIPSAIQEGALQRYGSIEEVRSRLTGSPILAPAYYPPTVRWPPSLIAAQSRPYLAVVTEFRKRDGDDTVLVINQTARHRTPLRESIVLSTVRERVSYPFKGRSALLEAGLCRTGERCSRLSWDEGDVTIELTIKDSPIELVNIADSMIAGPEGSLMHRSTAPGDASERK